MPVTLRARSGADGVLCSAACTRRRQHGDEPSGGIALAGSELVLGVQSSASKKISIDQIKTYIVGLISGDVTCSGASCTVGKIGWAGIPSTAIAKGNGAGGLTAATSGTDYAPATSGRSILKGSGSGGFSAATSGTDYNPPVSIMGVNTGAYNTAPSVADSLGFYAINRNSPTAVQAYKNGSSIATTTDSSTAVVNADLVFLRGDSTFAQIQEMIGGFGGETIIHRCDKSV